MSSAASPSPRFGHWVTFFIMSSITLGALIEARAHTDRLSPAARANQNYSVACCAILFLLSLLVVFFHSRPLLSGLIIGTRIEGVTIFVLTAFWSALVGIVSDTRHGLATDSFGGISNGNLYYFSWGGLATGVSLMSNYVRSVWGIDLTEELRMRGRRLQYWVCLGATGSIQMGSSARLFDNHCGLSSAGLGVEEMGSIKFCKRCQLGIAIGIFSAVTSMALIGIKLGITGRGRMPWLYATESILCCILVASQAVGVALLTSHGGPGAPLNNIFYSSWGSLIAGLVLTASCVEDWSAASGSLRGRADDVGENSIQERDRLVPSEGIS